MSERYTHKDAEKAVQRLAEAMSLPYGHYTVVRDEPEPFDGEQDKGRFKHQHPDSLLWFTTQPNALELDYNPVYGGCVVSQIMEDGGTGVSLPFSQERKGPREFVGYVNALISGMEMAS